MKGADIQIGDRYMMKVSDKLVTVKVLELTGRTTGFGDRTRFHDAWLVRNEETGRTIKVKSAQRFRPLPEHRKTPYERHAELGHNMTRFSPNGVDIIEECSDCGARWIHNPTIGRPLTLAHDVVMT